MRLIDDNPDGLIPNLCIFVCVCVCISVSVCLCVNLLLLLICPLSTLVSAMKAVIRCCSYRLP